MKNRNEFRGLRTELKAFAQSSALRPQSWDEWVLPNGLTFLYRQDPGMPLAAGTLLVHTGSRYERPDQAGLASLTAELMMQGTRRRSSQRLAETIESVGASLGIQASEDYTEIGHVAPVGQLDRILDVLTECLTEPVFSSDELKKERASTLASLKSRKDSLFTFAYDAFNVQMFGPHAYGRPIDGDPQTVKRFTREDCKRWHQSYFQPNRAVFSMVASLPPRDAKRQIEKRLSGWKKTAANGAAAAPSWDPPSADRRVRMNARFEQAYLMTGVPAPSVHDPEYVTLKVVNTVLGGGMSSRLFMRLREEMGLAYEVSSFFPTHVVPSQWVIYLGMPPEKLAVAQRELERLLETFQRQGPTAEEIQQAKAMIKGSYLMEHQTRRRQAWYAAWWKFLGNAPDHDRHFLAAVDQVTAEHARTLARRLLAQPRVTVEVAPKTRRKGKR